MSRAASIRTRLALQFAAAVAVLLLLYAGAVYAFTRAALRSQLQARLHEDFEAAEHGFTMFPKPDWNWAMPPLDEGSPEAPWAEIRYPDNDDLMLRRPEVPAVRPEDSVVYERDYEMQGVMFHIRVGRSRAPMEEALAGLLLLLAGCWVPAVALAFLVGRWFAGRALAPVAAMTERARSIGAESLSERLPVVNPADELGSLATVFNAAFARLEASFDALRRFTADASHELRTPLATLRSVGEVALRGSLSADAYREVVGSMLEECDRLGRLVEDLLALARADAGRLPAGSGVVALGDLAREMVRELGVLAEEKGQRIEIHEDAPARAQADGRRLRRAVQNLLHNAIRYAPDGSTVRVRTGRRGADAVLEVADEGPGIAPEHHAAVFERFFRVDPARHGGGSGLGLSIAKWAVEADGGHIELDSALGQGSTFRIVLPACDTPAT
jgi:heavy metal sensor kinase